MASLESYVGDIVPLFFEAETGETGLFPQVQIRDEAGVVTAGPFSLGHLGDGVWLTTWTVPSAGKFRAEYRPYIDSGHPVVSRRYARTADIIVSDLASNDPAVIASAVWNADETLYNEVGSFSLLLKTLAAVAGFRHVLLDNLTYNSNGFLQSGRYRAFANAADAAAATPGSVVPEGEIATVQLSGDPINPQSVLPAWVRGVGP